MPSFDKNEIKAYLEQLVTATQKGSMSWLEVNPTTYSWDTAKPISARLTVQLVTRQIPSRQPSGQITIRQTKGYLFQAVEIQRTGQKVRLSVNGIDDEELNAQLEILYEAIASRVTEQSLDFLKSILPPKDAV